MSIIWLLFWLGYKRPSISGDEFAGLSGWGIALAICLVWDVASF